MPAHSTPLKAEGAGEGCSLVVWSLRSELCQRGQYYPYVTLGLAHNQITAPSSLKAFQWLSSCSADTA